jgi:hypothetical protein
MFLYAYALSWAVTLIWFIRSAICLYKLPEINLRSESPLPVFELMNGGERMEYAKILQSHNPDENNI